MERLRDLAPIVHENAGGVIAGRGGAVVSAERGDAGVGGDDRVGVGPAIEDADDVTAGVAHDAGAGMPEPPA